MKSSEKSYSEIAKDIWLTKWKLLLANWIFIVGLAVWVSTAKHSTNDKLIHTLDNPTHIKTEQPNINR